MLHIISFDIPYPPNYGGIIDVFYKIKSLSQLGIKIHLHCFEYNKPQTNELLKYCTKVTYYKRKTGLKSFFQTKPYIVTSRANLYLLENLLLDENPILFEGLHTTYFLNFEELKNRQKFVRTHNVEHEYYKYLADLEKFYNPTKYYFYSEALKLKSYESILSKSDQILAISQNDFEYFNSNYQNVNLIPAFHQFENVESTSGKGNYMLYHGKLSVGENINACLYLINNIFCKLKLPVVIAGFNPHQSIYQAVSKLKNCKIVANPSLDEMHKLIVNAQISVLPTFQNTGIKLKLLHSLFAGRHCIVNSPMVENTGLESVCHVKNSPEEMISAIKFLFDKDFSTEMIESRKSILAEKFSNLENAKKISDLFLR